MKTISATKLSNSQAGRFRKLMEFWRRYKKNRGAVTGLAILIGYLAIALLADVIAPNPPLKISIGAPFTPPGASFIMGTDDLGRDLLSGVLHGSRTSLLIGFSAATISATIGMLLGAISGFFGGRIDDLIMRITEIFMVIPTFFLILVVVAVVGPSIITIILVIGILSWPVSARLVRSEFLTLKERPYVEAARALGASPRTLIFREIMPNAWAPLIINTSLEVGRAILTEAGVSFLGLGDPTVPSWGQMLNNAQSFLRVAWWFSAFPGIAISLIVLALNLIGDGLNDALNPRISVR